MSLYEAFARAEIAYRQQRLHQLADRTSHPARHRARPRPRWQGSPAPDRVVADETAPVRH